MNTDPNLDRDSVRLLASEREAIRSRIVGAPARVPAFRFPVRPVAFSLAALLVFAGGTYAAQASGSGDLFHAVELGFVEPLQEKLFVSEADRPAYRVARLEERLEELQAAGEVAPDALAQDLENVASHAEEAVRLAQGKDPSARVDYLVQVSALVEATEDVLAERNAEEQIVEVGDAVADELSEQVDVYAAHADETLPAVVSAELEFAGDLVEAGGTGNDPETVADLRDIAQELEEEDLGDALQIVTQVQVDALVGQLLGE